MDGHVSLLAKEVLEEVPDQITSFMSMKQLHPLQKNNMMHAKQPTMDNIYEGPSTLVRTATQNNVYPNLQQNQPMNPHYGQQQQQQATPTSYGSQMQKSASVYS